MMEHRVYFKLKPDVSENQFLSLQEHILGLKDAVYGITNVYFGKNISSEGKSLGCENFFVMLFRDESCRNIYLWHPEHKWVAEHDFRPYVDEVLVFDSEI